MTYIDTLCYPRLSPEDTRRALNFWWKKFNTAEIAREMKVEEAAVANSLAHWREDERERRRRAVAV